MARSLRTTALFVVICGGLGALATYYGTVTLVPGASFIFSGIFYLLVALLCGPVPGALAALLASMPTMWMWGEPTTLITRPLEAFFTGWLVRRKNLLPLYANFLFWLVVGIPLVYLIQSFGPNLSGPLLWIVLLKQPLNGLINVIVATVARDSAYARGWCEAEAGAARPMLRATLSRAMILLVLVPTIGLGLYQARRGMLDAEAEALLHLRETALSAARDVDDYLREHRTAILSLASGLQRARAMSENEMNALLDERRRFYPGFLTMLVFGRDGVKRAASPQVSATGEPILGDHGNILDRDYFQKPIATGEPFISGAFAGRVFGRDPIVAISAPLRSANGEIVGIVEGSLDLRRFSQIEAGHADLDVVLLDGANRVVFATPRTGYTFLQVLDKDPLLERERASGASAFSVVREADATQRMFLTSFAPAQITDWKVFVQHPRSIIEAEAQQFFFRILSGVLLAVVVMILMVEGVSRHATEPIEQLAASVRATTTGGEREPLVLARAAPREIAQLVEDFQQMSARVDASHQRLRELLAEWESKVEQRTRQLAGEKAVLERIASGEPLPAMLDLICREMEKLSPGMLCSILLVDAAEEKLRLGAAPSLPAAYGEVVEGMPVSAQGSPCGRAAFHRAAEVVPDFEADASYASIVPLARQFNVRACWSTPIYSTGEEVLGTFGIYFRKPATPTPADFELIERATSLAAIAIERHRAQEQVRLQSQRQRDILDSLLPFVGLFSVDGKLLEVNKSALDSLGLTREQMVGRSFFDSPWLSYSPEVQQLYRENFARAAAGETVRFDGPARIAPNVTLTVDNIFSPMRDASGKIVQVVGSAVDVTQRVQLEDQLRHAQKMEAIGRLAGGVAHDFNNLLMVIRGHSEMLLERTEDAATRQNAEEIQKSADRAAALTRQLLAFSRKQVLAPKVLDLNDVIHNMESLLRRLIGEHIELSFSPGAATGKIRADQGQIEQVIMNLAVNARDAMPNGGKLVLETNAFRQTDEGRQYLDLASGDYALLVVRDSGIGMDEETRKRLFEPFFTTKGIGQGTGLGLATVYGIVRQSGGIIEVDSEFGHGTAFRIYLPLAGSPDPEAAPAHPEPSGAPQAGSETLLFVEDEDSLRELAREFLAERGYSVLTAVNGEDALKLLREHRGKIDLLITDVIMPGISGRELAVRFQQAHPQAKVLFVSGYIDDDLLHRRGLDGHTAFLQKPFRLHALAAKLREVLV